MQINNLNCCKPRKFMNFKGHEETAQQRRKPRYKHYEQMSDNVLEAYSVMHAHKSVEKSGKMRLFKAIPLIATTIIGTSLALSQPGKLSAKAIVGLGFLTLAKSANDISDTVNDVIDKKFDNRQKNANTKKSLLKIGSTIATCAAVAVGSIALVKSGKKVLNGINPNVANFFKGEATKLASEIDETKLGKFVENTLNPFISKHENKINIIADTIPFVTAFGAITAQSKLSKSLSKDFRKTAQETFLKGKMIQQVAKQNFDSVDAQEI